MPSAAAAFEGSSPRLLLLLFVALLAWPATVSADTHPHTRQGWYAGLGFGAGSAELTAEGESSGRSGGAAGTIRVGYAFNPRMALGFESNLWFKSQDDIDFTLSTYTAAFSFFPAEGLVLRAGIGGGDADAEVSSGSTTVTTTESGLGLTAGVAYEFRLARRFAAGPQVDFNYMNLDSFDANFIDFGFEFNWYFIPRQ
jgi:hypothetical protein